MQWAIGVGCHGWFILQPPCLFDDKLSHQCNALEIQKKRSIAPELVRGAVVSQFLKARVGGNGVVLVAALAPVIP